MAGLGEGPGEPSLPPPLFFDLTEAQRVFQTAGMVTRIRTAKKEFELRYSLLEIHSRKFFSILRIERDRISALKFKAAQVYFLSDFFVTVAVVDALAPYFPSSNETLHIMHCYAHDIGTQ